MFDPPGCAPKITANGRGSLPRIASVLEWRLLNDAPN